jgi:Tfp pilus assembly protein PilO
MTARSLTPRERRITIVTVLILGGGLAYAYAIGPMIHTWTDLRAAANALTAERAELTQLLEHRGAIEAQYSGVESAVAEGQSEEALQIALLTEVEDLARRSGLVVGSIKPMGRDREGPFERIHVQLNAQCEHHQFVNFLQGAQRRERLLRCEAVTLTVGRTRPPVNVTLTISKLVKIGGAAS